MYKCINCNKGFNNLNSLRRHRSGVHKISSQQTYNEYILDNNIPTCSCGCGEIPSFISFNKGYKQWLRGHIARIENNWGHNPTAISKSAKTRRKQYANGERETWNKGLTKNDHPSIKKYAMGISDSWGDEKKEKYSKLMKENRFNGVIPTRYGKNSPNWKGGKSSIYSLIYSDSELYKKWKYPILKEYNFKCNRCKSTDNLQVHHDDELMANIIDSFIDDRKEYSFEEKKKITKKVVKYHIEENVSGEVLCKECHKEEHPSYNL